MRVSSTFSNQMLSSYGAYAIAAMGVAGKASMIVAMVQIGTCMGSQPLIAYNYGAKNMARMKEIIKKMAITTVVTGLLLTILCIAFKDSLITMFVNDARVIGLGKDMMTIMMLSSPVPMLFLLNRLFGLHGLIYAGIVADIVSILFGLLLCLLQYRKLNVAESPAAFASAER